MQSFSFFFLFVMGGGGDFGSGSGSKFNCAARVGSDDLGYGPGSGFSFEPVQTSTAYPTLLTNQLRNTNRLCLIHRRVMIGSTQRSIEIGL